MCACRGRDCFPLCPFGWKFAPPKITCKLLKLSSFFSPVELDAEHAQRVPGAEQGGAPAPQVKLKERQKFFEEAFQQDMEQYLSTGYLQIAERRGQRFLPNFRLQAVHLKAFLLASRGRKNMLMFKLWCLLLVRGRMQCQPALG